MKGADEKYAPVLATPSVRKDRTKKKILRPYVKNPRIRTVIASEIPGMGA